MFVDKVDNLIFTAAPLRIDEVYLYGVIAYCGMMHQNTLIDLDSNFVFTTTTQRKRFILSVIYLFQPSFIDARSPARVTMV